MLEEPVRTRQTHHALTNNGDFLRDSSHLNTLGQSCFSALEAKTDASPNRTHARFRVKHTVGQPVPPLKRSRRNQDEQQDNGLEKETRLGEKRLTGYHEGVIQEGVGDPEDHLRSKLLLKDSLFFYPLAFNSVKIGLKTTA